MATLIRIDRNGTKYWFENRCSKCGGTGRVPYLVDNGICWQCGGNGIHPYTYKEYTPEYAQKLANKRLEKARKAAPEKNKKFRESLGLNEDGSAWVVINKYAKSADMKPLGAHWTPAIGWYFKDEHEGTFFVTGEEMGVYDPYNGMWSLNPEIGKVLDEKRNALLPKSNSEYIGNVGEKLDTVAVFDHEARFETHFTYYGETVCILTFKAGDNTIVWKTSSYNALEKGKKYRVRGTVKEHSEYRGDKQTVLTRCKIEEIKEEENGEN